MKTLVSRSLWLWLCLTLTAAADTPTLVVSTIMQAPFLYREQGQFKGLFQDILSEAFTPLGYRVTFAPQPFRRARFQAAQGETDLILLLQPPQASQSLFKEFITSHNALMIQRVAALVLRNRQEGIRLPEDFNRLRMGHIRLIKELHDVLAPLSQQRQSFRNSADMIKALLTERIDVAIMTPSLIPVLSRQLGFREHTLMIAHEFPPQPIIIGWSQHPSKEHLLALREPVDRELLKLKQSGRIREILQQHSRLEYFEGY